jgi:hypothetical protein
MSVQPKRSDIAYAVSVMGRNLTKKPKWFQQIGQHVLGFLCNAPETCLLYRPCNKDHGARGALQAPRHDMLLKRLQTSASLLKVTAVTKASYCVLQDLRFNGKPLGKHFTL